MPGELSTIMALHPPALVFALKIAYTLFVAILVPSYWRSCGPGNLPICIYLPSRLLLQEFFSRP